MTSNVQFQISTGELSTFDATGTQTIIGYGYAGHPPHVNDPNACRIHGVGPLPVGAYFIGAPEDRLESVGVFALPLTPAPGTEMFGRGSFYIHGDNPEANQTASDGCIVATRPLREICATLGVLEVIA